tara:strand:- start:21 stop:407 length:387 start_codon:yes stop_codon:yes gene_type:complete
MEKNSSSTALVTIPKLMPPSKHLKHSVEVNLVDDELRLKDREQVRKLLPDILGRVLARIWIDPNFHLSFATDPKGTLEKNGVFIPSEMYLDFEKPDSDRPKIVVYEKKNNSKFKLRILYLQLVMMAGR